MMNRIEIVRELDSMAREHKCDLWNDQNIERLKKIKMEIETNHYCIGAPSYQELNKILEYSIDGGVCPYIDEHKYLDLRGFFDVDDEVKDIVEECLGDLNIDYLYDDEVRDILCEIACHKPAWKFIQLLVGYPVWEPKGRFEDAITDKRFFMGREEDYSYETIVILADISTVRAALGWLQAKTYAYYLS